ncbi:MAG: Phosphate butyryltransferase [Thermotoga sp. 50_1627]|uniref:bifunctional enoyl-CoA hydratase/phosphate acetyltransferase n=1 Tax=Pseudothermotoga sp. TaxID=2033661 RepID=UPI00076D665A|nr:MAG: Phosphate butyryltransferase [Thermotoga sp. 50_64]KUK25791.1 MAG: Phosphate butyryltransferase [Thermotoga sp. 50_1627]MBC7115476.1 bifunctional enoyl-CoA hydratase/phosphate acetyltransferase [Pseudothermotoga sp.]MDK2922864.1 phosphate butyryltransferase [Pseudothermotoga sp.]HBT40106.1 phosphate butyryltransferase [Pseudothermotoga sp.]
MDRLAFLVEKTRGLRKRIVVAGSDDDVVLSALKMAMEHDIVEPVLVGPESETRELAAKVGLKFDHCELIDCPKDQSARLAVEIASNRGDLLMKGSVKTADLMKVVLEDQYNLKTGSTITMVSVFDVPAYHKLLAISDAGMIIAPTLEQKIDMINVAVKLMKKLGVERPKVAIVGAIEVPNAKMPATLDAAVLSKMNDRGQIKDCVVDGPFALDNAISKDAARHKKIESAVAGDADILIMPDIEAGNVLYKALVFFANATVASVILGARIPIVLTSRADSDRTKLYSIALAASLS